MSLLSEMSCSSATMRSSSYKDGLTLKDSVLVSNSLFFDMRYYLLFILTYLVAHSKKFFNIY